MTYEAECAQSWPFRVEQLVKQDYKASLEFVEWVMSEFKWILRSVIIKLLFVHIMNKKISETPV